MRQKIYLDRVEDRLGTDAQPQKLVINSLEPCHIDYLRFGLPGQKTQS